MDSGRKSGPTQGDRTPLSVARIASCALALADELGLESVSMRRLAERLGVEAMSLYYHVPSKAALLDAMANELGRELPEPPPGPWRDCLTAVGRAWRDLARRHPGGFVLLATRSTTGTALLERGAILLDRLQSAGFSAPASARAITSFFTSLNGFLLAAGAPALLRDVPEIHADEAVLEAAGPSFASVPAEAWSLSTDASFEFHLAVVLDGLQAALERDALRGLTGSAPVRAD